MENLLCWFGHVRQRPREAPIIRLECRDHGDLRSRRRQKMKWIEEVKEDGRI